MDEELVRWMMADVFGQLSALPPPPDWYQDAACMGLDPGVFFPEKGGSTQAAKAVCDGCPVAEQCLTFALDDEGVERHRYGVWGGMSPRERVQAAVGVPIDYIIIGALHGYYGQTSIDEFRADASRNAEVYGDDRNLITAEHGGRPLTWDEARPLLDYPYDTGFGGNDCHAIWAWTSRWILFVSVYDGATMVERVPRNPVEGGIPELIGGQ